MQEKNESRQIFFHSRQLYFRAVTVALRRNLRSRFLKRLGRTAELIVSPGEPHEFKTPSHMDRFERQLAWFNHYVKGGSAPPRPPEQPVTPVAKPEN